jgi:hypothetical protein
MQMSAATHFCTAATVLLFITDKFTKQRFLINTPSDL